MAEVDGGHRPPTHRRAGIVFFAKLVSVLTGERVTDTTSGFQALNHRGIALFARDYPTDYPEVEAIMLVSKHRLRLVEVPVRMLDREHGKSSITFLRSVYYMFKVTLALLVARCAEGRGSRAGAQALTPVSISIASSVASVLLLLIVFELIRGRRLKERYALLWIATGIVLLVLSAWRGGLDTVAGWLGVATYPPAILFAVATLFIIAVLLHYSTVLSRLSDDNTLLAQRLALLEQRLEELAGRDRERLLRADSSTARAGRRRGSGRPRRARTASSPARARRL